MPIIESRNLTFAYEDDIVLENVNLTVSDGDFLAIIGPNGGGKSTLIKLILGLLKPTKGELAVLGSTPGRNPNLVGYVPQNTNVNTSFPITVLEVVLMGHTSDDAPLWGYGKNEKSCAMSALAEVGMQKYARRRIGELSGGQRQRVMMARALCSHPKILLLDEPTASIDVKGQKDIYRLLQRLNNSMTIIVVSHDISIILEYANKAAHINKHLSYHDIGDKQKIYHKHDQDKHFCEIELLQMLASSECKECTNKKVS